MLVCHCKAVTDTTIRNAIRGGSKTLCQIGQICRAGTECGGCHQAIEKMLRFESGGILPSASANHRPAGRENLVPL